MAKRKRYTDAQIAIAVREMEGGTNPSAIARKLGVSVATLYNWRKKYEGMNGSDMRKLRQLQEENRKLKQAVADLTLDKMVLQDVLSKKD